jgi:catechol 2,3-dioxygenase-like lactoylglutathione lyase family enzyme
MLRKIDCVMVPVSDLDAGVDLYQRAFGLTVHWRDAVSVGLGLQDSATEVVLNVDGISGVHYLVDDVPAAVGRALAEGCTLIVKPFEDVVVDTSDAAVADVAAAIAGEGVGRVGA